MISAEIDLHRFSDDSQLGHTRSGVHAFLRFVGRDDELAALSRARREAENGRGGLWLLSGDPGIGKSRLCEETAQLAARDGFTIAWGRCWEAGGAPSFWPWVQVLRALRRSLGEQPFTPSIRARLAHLLPELRAADASATSGEVPAGDRFQQMEAIVSALCELAGASPLLFVLDDLHAADHSSLLLLDFASRQLHSVPVVLLGTYRPQDARRSEHASLISRIAQNGKTLALRPLNYEAVSDYLESAAIGEVADDLAHALHARTEGNPLFMVELVRLIASAPNLGVKALAEASLPPGLEDAIRSHLDQLTTEAREIVEIAAISGREVYASALASHFDSSLPEATRGLEEAHALGLLQSLGSGSYRFSHILVRDLIERDIPGDRRTALHKQLAESLAKLPEASWSEVAHHFAAAGPSCTPQTIDALARAAEDAIDRLAFESAESSLHHALDLLAHSSDTTRRAELLITLCQSQIRSGRREAGRVSCRNAVALARDLGDAELLAKAALELGSILVAGEVDPELVSLLREALDGLPDGDSRLRAIVQARLAAAMQPAEDPEEPIALARSAIDMARRIGDDETLLIALRTGCSAMVDMAPPEIRLELDREHARLAAAAGARMDAFRGQTRLIFDYFEIGDRLGADAAVRAAAQLIEEIDHPSVAWRLPAMRAMRAMWDGALEDALEANAEASSLGALSGDPNARTTTLYQRQRILYELGRTDELPELYATVEGLFTNTPAMDWYVKVTIAGHKLGLGFDRESALQGAVGAPIEGTLKLGDRTIMEALAEVALASGDVELAHNVRERLIPIEHQLLGGGVIGMTWHTSAHRPLALCERALGNIEAAAKNLEKGIEAVRRVGGEPAATRMRQELGALYAELDRPEEAREQLEAASSAATSLGMTVVEKMAQERLRSLGWSPSEQPRADRAPAPTFAREDDVWRIRYLDREFRLKNSKGLQFIATLTAEPRRDFHVLELSAPGKRHEVDGDAGEILDETAQQAYRQRLRDLQDTLDQAEEWNDAARAEAARSEIDALTSELARGLGLGGRSRRFQGNAERARINVQRRIRDAIRRIRESDDGLARHLERSLKTGMHCRYDPE